jgi:hypothetical protein
MDGIYCFWRTCRVYHLSLDVQPGCDEIALIYRMDHDARLRTSTPSNGPYRTFNYDHDHVNIRGTENRIACISLEVEVCSGLLGRIRGRIYS